ncbi:MAG: MFS transporter [Jatrophihabitans sp.]|uniref:MFS transporter n=1 Tax=Jatrophihabitans sp. TaxID=1932789 RepID=UPI003910076E
MTDSSPDRPASARLVLLLACGAAFLSLLDATVVNLAIADLHRDFPATTVTTLSWTITAYAVLLAAMLAAAGRLADTVGARRMFIGGVGTFTAFSLACAVAPNPATLIAFRALQGIGAAAMIPASLALLLTGIPADLRARSIGLWSGAGGLAAAVGPALGGLLVEPWTWRAVFAINVPMGLAMLWGARRLSTARRSGARVPDLLGSMLLAAGIGAVALAVTEGGTWGWSAGTTWACLVGGVAAGSVAVARSRTRAAPAVEVGLWRNSSFAATNLASLLYGAALYAWLLVGVLLLTEVWHYSVLKAGLAVTPGAFTSMIGAVVGGRLIDRYGPRPVLAAGALTMTGSGLATTAWLPATPHFLTFWLPVGAVVGLGMGAAAVATNSAAALAAPPLRFAGAVGLNTTARQIGGALGIAVLDAIQRSAADDGLRAFTGVYAYCAAASLGCLVAGLAIRPAATVPVAPSIPLEGAVR